MSDVIHAAGAPAPTAAVPERPVAAGASTSFLDVLSSLNPLQHIPVVGTIYRAITGDVIPEGARLAGSMVFSGLVFGPFGLATTAAAAAFGKLTGLDSEEIGRDVLSRFEASPDGGAPPAGDTAYAAYVPEGGVPGNGAPAGEAAPVAVADRAATPEGPAAAAASAAEDAGAPRRAISPSQLVAYGVTRTAGGALRRDETEGSDVLNTLELLRIGTPTAVAAAYGRAVADAAPAAA